MQTFLPSANYIFAAQYLDNKRLNKQILEGYQILKVLSTNGKAWRNHPAVLMWEGSEYHLYDYVQTMIKEAKYRGIKTDKNEENIEVLFKTMKNKWGSKTPEWYLNKDTLSRIVATHKANLYRKDPIYYAEHAKSVNSKYNTPCCEKCLYYWPTHPLTKANSK
jgi:hypothetical protein